MSYSTQCAGSEAVHVCSECPGDRVREFARTRGSGFVKESYLAELMVDPTDIDLWNAGIQSGDIIMVPKTSGSYDPGTPKELAGFGDAKVSYGTREMKLSYNDPDYYDNYAFYNEIVDRTDLIPFFRTSNLVHIFDTVAAIIASDPVADDIEAEVIWNVVCTVVSKNLPSKHPLTGIKDIFSCVGGAAPAPYTFYFGSDDTPENETDIKAGTSSTANHNAKAIVSDFANGADAILWYAEPSTEPEKTVWFNTSVNNGPIGAGQTFLAPVIVGSFRLYVSGAATTFSSPSAVEFRVS